MSSSEGSLEDNETVDPKVSRQSSLDDIDIEKLVERTWRQLTKKQRLDRSDKYNMKLCQIKERPFKVNHNCSCLCPDCKASTANLLPGASTGLVEDKNRKAPPKKRPEREAKKAAMRLRKPRVTKPLCGEKPQIPKPKPKPKKAAAASPRNGKK